MRRLYKLRCLTGGCGETKEIALKNKDMILKEGDFFWSNCIGENLNVGHAVEEVKGYVDEEETAACPHCLSVVEIETILKADGLVNICMNCQSEVV